MLWNRSDFFKMSSYTSPTDSTNAISGNHDAIILQGYHKKLKTMKKKYFVLYSDVGDKSARLEYFDSEKKFKTRSNPKRVIVLKNCFNINRRLDTKYNNVIALSTREEVFCIVLDTEAELNEWLRALLALQRGEDTEVDQPKPFFEHVWQVQVQRKGSAEEKGIIGKYYVCLTTKSVTLVRIGTSKTTMGENRLASVEFYLTTIRRCGDSQCFFYMEVGRHSAIGAGELWMQTEDPLIAQNMHAMIISSMSSCKNMEDVFAPISRKRALSATEASKPIAVLHRRQTHAGNKPINSSPLSGFAMGRDRCDSLPSRSRTTSECTNSQLITNSTMPPPTRPVLSNRPLSICVAGNRHSHSPPLNTLSPSTGCSESDGSSLSIDETDSFIAPNTPDESGNFVDRFYNPHTSGTVIPEENFADKWLMDKKIPRILDNMNNVNGRLALPITYSPSVQNIRKSSPVSHIEFVDIPGQYMDMFSPHSPQGSSPCDHSGIAFIPVSPSNDHPRGTYTGSSGVHSRASSLAEETVDGYVPMCPHTTHGYVDMEQSAKQHIHEKISLAASTCSVISGTPSTDMRFAEYSLDKVKSRFTPEDDDLQPPDERPIRAYSVGSRPEHAKRKLRIEVANTEDQNNLRIRAFSVGSRAKVPRSDLYRSGFTPILTCQMNNNNNNSFNTAVTGGNSKGAKSSSAPLLANKSQNSVDRMSDLMEIDFTKNTEIQVKAGTNIFNNRIQSQEGTATSPCTKFPPPGSFVREKSESFENSPQEMSHGYLIMKPRSHTEKSSSKSGRMKEKDGYLEMKPVGFIETKDLSISPTKTAADNNSPNPCMTKEASYMNISTKNPAALMQKLHSSNCATSSSHGRYMKTEAYIENPAKLIDGYMEMSFNKSQCASTNEALPNKGDAKKLDELRYVTPPIDIVTKEKLSNLFSDELEKAAYKNDSNNSESIYTTPHHPTIFPFSPESPSKGFIVSNYGQQKCFIDATFGNILSDSMQNTSKSSGSGTEVSHLTIDEKQNLNSNENISSSSLLSVETLSSEYADMSLASGIYNPDAEIYLESGNNAYVEPMPYKIINNNFKAEHAILSHIDTKTSILLSNKRRNLAMGISECVDGWQKFSDFVPIFTTDESTCSKDNMRDERSKNINQRVTDHFRKHNDNSCGYELLHMKNAICLQSKIINRPNSVISEKISPSKTICRHTLASSEIVKSIPSSSVTNICGPLSSTICRGKSQSPLSSSRPQSFSEAYTLDTTPSRPEHVASIGDHMLSSRPMSVSSERELHYVSLDLPTISSNIATPTAYIETNKSYSITKGNNSTACESLTSPNSNTSGSQEQPTFTYAQIDFNKSHECCK